MVRNIEHTRAKSNGLGVGSRERKRIQGVENVFVLFREQTIGCNRIGCLGFDRPKQPLNRPKAVVGQSLSTLSHLNHSLGSGDGTDIGKGKPSFHRKEYFPELVAKDLDARSIGGVPCIVKSP